MGGGYPLEPLSQPLPGAGPKDTFCFHILAHSFALFCFPAKVNSSLFNRFRTLCTKYRGWGEEFLIFRGEKTCPAETASARQGESRQSPRVADSAAAGARVPLLLGL